MRKITVKVQNQEGLHARPASVFSKAAMKYKCELQMFKNNDTKAYNPKSILSVLSIGAIKGDDLTIIANGVDEVEATLKLKEIIAGEFIG